MDLLGDILKADQAAVTVVIKSEKCEHETDMKLNRALPLHKYFANSAAGQICTANVIMMFNLSFSP